MASQEFSQRSRKNTDADNWYGIQDPRERKKIQDRLAQRARRKRLQAAKIKSSTESSPDERKETSALVSTNDNPSVWTIQMNDFEMAHTPPLFETWASTPSDNPVRCASSLALPSDHHFLPDPSMSVHAAMYINGAMVGLSCSTVIPCKSNPVSPSIPGSLHPTALQLLTIHVPWIDRFPFSRMRDNMITLSATIDDEDFLSDLFTKPSFSIKAGKPSWDPGAWTIVGKDFKEKWGYLLY